MASGVTAIAAWHGAPTVAAAARMAPFVKEVSAASGGPIYIFVVIEADIDAPDEAARSTMADSMTKTAPLTKHIVSVILGEGFRASVVRSIAAGMQLLARKAAPMKVFRKVDEAIDWLVQHDPSVGTRDDLRRAVQLATTGK